METGQSQAKPLEVWAGIHAVSADGDWLASITPYGPNAPTGARLTFSMTVRDLRQEDVVRKLTYDAPDNAGPRLLGLSADGGLLAEGRSDGTVAVWNVVTSKIQTTWKCQVTPMTRLTFSWPISGHSIAAMASPPLRRRIFSSVLTCGTRGSGSAG